MHQTPDIIASFDRYLETRGHRFDAVVIGGAALTLLGIVSRLTKDRDILFPEIPEQIASQTFAREVRGNVGDLGDEWLNIGPASLQTQLPPGWEIIPVNPAQGIKVPRVPIRTGNCSRKARIRSRRP